MLPDAIEIVAETGSTNADLLARLRAGEDMPEGKWLIADRQSAGRGRRGRDWRGELGNFLGSTIVHAQLGDPPLPSLALATGIAVRAAVLAHRPLLKLRLKWPNDLLTDSGKLAGILLEGEGRSVVVGIGVNLALAPKLSVPTASLNGVSRNGFAGTLRKCFSDELALWRADGLSMLRQRWMKYAHPQGTALSVQGPDGAALSGTFAGLDASGAMLLRLANGDQRTIHAGDVMLEDY